MTTGLLARVSPARGHELHPGLGRSRAMILALLFGGCVAAVATSTPRVTGFGARAPAEPAEPARAAAPVAQPASVAPATAMPSASSASREIDTLATLAARKYRVSAAATRGMVAAAYREGSSTGLDPLLILAVIAVESRFNPIAESDSGAQGLMQIIPAYHKDQFGAAIMASVLDPQANIRFGARILKEYIRRGGNEVAGLQLYNGSSDDPSTAYAVKVLGEKTRLEQALKRVHNSRGA